MISATSFSRCTSSLIVCNDTRTSSCTNGITSAPPSRITPPKPVVCNDTRTSSCTNRITSAPPSRITRTPPKPVRTNARVRSEIWSACFGKTLLHARELTKLIRGHDVLILGETGVGKEDLARAIALGTVRRHGDGTAPYAALNVAAVPETLVEAELFGHVKGALTGAHGARIGLVRSADGGCLLLDEVGDLPLATQAKLLRVIETDHVQPLGTEQVHAVDMRFVSATHHDLAARIAQGSFRADLYQRLGAHVIRVPPLRERPEDIAAIGLRFLRAATERAELDTRPAERWLHSADARAYHWPGNARELRNVVGNLLLGLPLHLASADLASEQGAPLPSAILEARAPWATVQAWYMKRVLTQSQGNIAQAARVLAPRSHDRLTQAITHAGGSGNVGWSTAILV